MATVERRHLRRLIEQQDELSDSERRSLLTKEQAADMLNVSLSTVKRMLVRGELRHYKIGKAVRIARQNVYDKLEEWLVED